MGMVVDFQSRFNERKIQKEIEIERKEVDELMSFFTDKELIELATMPFGEAKERIGAYLIRADIRRMSVMDQWQCN